MDIHEAISMDNSQPDKLLKTFIYLKHCCNSIYFKDFSVADRMQICLDLRRGKKHASTLMSNCFIDLQDSCGTQCNNILPPLF